MPVIARCLMVLATLTLGLLPLSAHESKHSIPADVRGKGPLPACDDIKVINKVTKRFAWADKHTWHRGITISAVDRVRDRGETDYPPSTIGRRWCVARATLSDGHHHKLWYLIEERQGFASLTWNVEFCMPGHDRWYVYSGWCRVLSDKSPAYGH